ncbi:MULTISPECIES: cytochrome c peroxidase [unclassified Variovorax]|jgi:cytochrome c peroxidase|uniref:cytochrome-c peroxidase n=1 Tax=unclassified Variovorax TaxID=663243 RepID=UPI000F7E287A|nr:MULTISPECIES: cytochrome c peroxidase [unclassified Variovorax]RSZ36232.1 cytochrome-c peroxidase [Variovorax sp. 553]RSZ36610.1 cytochrome-c peroxidase [Variovorax sp. 679]
MSERRSGPQGPAAARAGWLVGLAALAVAGVAGGVLMSCGGGGGGGSAAALPPASAPAAAASLPAAPAAATSTLSLAAQVGQKMFFDKNLSGSGAMSCASCHDPAHAYAPANDLSVQLGGVHMDQAGLRAVPSLRYKNITPAYADLLDNPDGISVPGPGGGFTWDGRADTLAAQARIPLLDPIEMANASTADVVNKLKAADYAPLIVKAFGEKVFDDSDAAFANALLALQAYQLEDTSFHPYSSKFDLYAANKIGGNLTAAETRGLKVFTNPNTGNCASCHYQGAGLNGSSALFTDFSYEAISVPRNAGIPANNDLKYFDMGVCGPMRTDHVPAAPNAANSFCGMFKAPTMRNVATRQAFFHNGVMHSLEQVIRFYNTRDTKPELWYPTVGGTPKAKNDADFPAYGLVTTQYTGGKVQKYDDLPPAYAPNIDTQLPMDGRAAGTAPPMSEQDIADLICFLNTLSDADTKPATPAKQGACVN